jgi:hypothetical protein
MSLSSAQLPARERSRATSDCDISRISATAFPSGGEDSSAQPAACFKSAYQKPLGTNIHLSAFSAEALPIQANDERRVIGSSTFPLCRLYGKMDFRSQERFQ